MSRTNTKDVEVELLSHLCVSSCGTADMPTLIFLTDQAEDLVQDALERLVGYGEAERVGVAFRITDKGRERLNGGRS